MPRCVDTLQATQGISISRTSQRDQLDALNVAVVDLLIRKSRLGRAETTEPLWIRTRSRLPIHA